ncbi:MAG TPA: Stk1 family PASTA domain-containing Ser/Thr kinase [Clostridiaceae bacterium]|nr:Stk1 family PASTA domain-containing Ser/Thr kinase [Clostridiaceae bacterium]
MSVNSNGPEGMVLGGRYRIVRLVGSGGMANVYLATDLSSGSRVAIKILKPEFSSDTEFIKRFDTEAKAAASLSHSNIVKVLGIGQEGGFRYMVQEYVEGVTVKDLINQNGHLDWRIAVPIAIQVGLALDHAHQNGIVHRDIKPHNIMISKERIAKVADFGIARAATSNTITLTSGGALGSVHYFSPEQARGALVGPASDIYSLGVMLFEMLTGSLPFDGDTPVAIAVKHLQEPVPLASGFVPGIPPGLDAIIQKSMQKSPEYRYASVRDFVAELDALMVDPSGAYGIVSQKRVQEASAPVSSIRQEPSYGKIRDIERSIDRRRASRVKDVILVVLLVTVIVGVLIGLAALIMKTIADSIDMPENTTFVVSNYVGRTIPEVIEEFKAQSFEQYEVEYVKRSGYAENVIFEQSLAAGTEIKKTSKLTKLVLKVSVPEDLLIIEEYREMDLEQAETLLKAKGFIVTTRPEVTDDYPQGKVIRTEPAAGTAVEPGSLVILVYSQETETVEVPELKNLTLATAEKIIDEHSLLIGQIEYTEAAKLLNENEQYVLLTDPVAGTLVSRRSSIKLYVGTVEDAQRGGTPTPTPTPAPYALNLFTDGGGTVEGSGIYLEGLAVTVRAFPAEGFEFKYWVDSTNVIVSTTSEFAYLMPNHDETLKAVFAPLPTPIPTPTLTPTPTPTMTPTHLLSLVVDGSGSVEGGGSYSAGVQVNVRAFPAEGFAFVKWVDSTNNTVSTTSEFAYLMPNRAETLKAVFAPVNSPDNHDSSSDTNSSLDD